MKSKVKRLKGKVERLKGKVKPLKGDRIIDNLRFENLSSEFISLWSMTVGSGLSFGLLNDSTVQRFNCLDR